MFEFIKCLEIGSFRGISNLKLDDLMQINILTGDNNCGKTSVLEAIQSLNNPTDFNSWRLLLRKDASVPIFRGISYYEGFVDLFDINKTEKVISYTASTGNKNLNVIIKAECGETEISETEYELMTGVANYFESNEDEDTEEHMQVVSYLDMNIYINGSLARNRRIYNGQRRYSFDKSKDRIEYNNPFAERVLYISPTRHAQGNLYLSEVLNQPELYEEMLAVLKEFDEDIISVNYDTDGNGSRGVYKILSKSQKRALPLNVYGDGMKKAVLLMSAVIKSQKGILLLDEFETAIHTSAMNKVFKWILDTCIRMNVQVFLTSHSKEAIDKVLKCSPELREKMALYTLYKDVDGVSVRRLSGDKAIEVQDEMGLELR